MSTTTYTTHIVYKTTNLVNNKIYIGIHSTNDINDGYLGSGVYLFSDLKKYGKENFKREVLYECSSRDIAAAIEASLVNEDFVYRKDTYNLKPGGCKMKNGKPKIKLRAGLDLSRLSMKERKRLAGSPRYKL